VYRVMMYANPLLIVYAENTLLNISNTYSAMYIVHNKVIVYRVIMYANPLPIVYTENVLQICYKEILA